MRAVWTHGAICPGLTLSRPCDWAASATRGRHDDIDDFCWPTYNLTEVEVVCANPIDRTYRIGSDGKQQRLDRQAHGRDIVAAAFVSSGVMHVAIQRLVKLTCSH